MPDSASDAPAAISRPRLRLAFAGLMLTLTLASLDQNIVGTALPQIVSELGGLAHLSWVVTAFMLASTVTTPLYGKLSDLYGRRPLFVAAIGLFLLGSALCGLAHGMTQLIFFRGVQGLGAGGLISLAQITIADLVSLRERGRYQGLFAAVFAVCSVAGPLIGGVITDVLSWRWIFYVNLPIGAAAVALLAASLPRTSERIHHRIDYAGALFLSGATAALLLMLSWGGSVYPWSSPIILGLGASAALLVVLLIREEAEAVEPILPLRLFADRVFVVAVSATGLTATALFGSFVFLPTFFQLVLGASPSASGLMIAPLMGGLIIASIAGGRLVSASGRYKPFPVLGLGVATVALLGLAWATATAANLFAIEPLLVLLGAGLGLVMPNLTVAIQNAVDRPDLGIATAAAAFLRSLGGAFGIALAGAIATAQVTGIASAMAPAGNGSATPSLDGLSPAAREALALAFRHALGTNFLLGAALAALAFAIVLLLPERPLRRSTGDDPQARNGGPQKPPVDG